MELAQEHLAVVPTDRLPEEVAAMAKASRPVVEAFLSGYAGKVIVGTRKRDVADGLRAVATRFAGGAK